MNCSERIIVSTPQFETIGKYVLLEKLAMGGMAESADVPTEVAAGDLTVSRRIRAWFEAAQVPCRVSCDIEADLWTKLITNVALNPVSAVARAT